MPRATPSYRLSSCHVGLYLIFIVVVPPPPFSLAVLLCPLCLLGCCPRVPGENKTEEWTRHLYSGALMESLRLKWQEVKGERTENSRQLHTTAAAVALPNHSAVMVWEVCVWACDSAGMSLWECVCEIEGREASEWGVFFCGWKVFCDQLFSFTGIHLLLVTLCCGVFERFSC